MARFLMSRTVLLVYGKTHLRNRGLEVRILPGVLIEKTLKATQNQGELSSWFLLALYPSNCSHQKLDSKIDSRAKTELGNINGRRRVSGTVSSISFSRGLASSLRRGKDITTNMAQASSVEPLGSPLVEVYLVYHR